MAKFEMGVNTLHCACWYLGSLLNLLHMPLFVGLIAFGSHLFGSIATLTLLLAIVSYQFLTKDCPLNYFVIKLKQQYEPNYVHRDQYPQYVDRFGILGARLLFGTMLGGAVCLSLFQHFYR
jgi:hypothetical protein